MGNNRLAWRVLEWMRGQGEQIVGLVVHTMERQRYRNEIVAASGVDARGVFEGPDLIGPETLSAIRALEPDLGVSVLFGHILKPDLLAAFPQGCINLHPALLPHNRGAYPNVWSIVDRAPAGVTLHYMDIGIDTGDVVVQREVAVEPIDTGETLYRKLETASFDLFTEAWPRFKRGELRRMPQDASAGTYHALKEVERIDRIDLDRDYKARDLLDVLRARTFPPYPSAYFEEGGHRVYVRVQLQYEDGDAQ